MMRTHSSLLKLYLTKLGLQREYDAFVQDIKCVFVYVCAYIYIYIYKYTKLLPSKMNFFFRVTSSLLSGLHSMSVLKRHLL